MSVNTPKLTQEEQACFEKVSKAPEAERQSVFASTCSSLKEHSRNIVRELLKKPKQTIAGAVLIGAGAVAPAPASTLSPQETQKIEQTQTTQENKDNAEASQEMLQIIDINQIPSELKSGVELTKTKYLEAVKDSNIRFPLIIETTNGNPSDLVNDMSLAPKKTYEELTGDKEFLPKNYVKVVNALYDTSDLKTWYRVGKERRLPTDEEIQKEIIRLENQKQRWLGKIQDWQAEIKAGTLDQKVFADFITLFNEGLKNLSMDSSREALRRLLVDAGTMAQFKNVKGDLAKSTVQELSNQVGEYVQLTDKNSRIVKIGYGETAVDKVYLFPSKSDVNNNVVLKNYPFFENMGNDSLSYFNEESITSFKTLIANIQGEQLKTELAQNKSELAQNKAELAQNKSELAQNKTELAQINSEGEQIKVAENLAREFDRLNTKVSLLLIKYQETKDESVLKELKSDVEKLKSYKSVLESNLKDESKKDFYNGYNTMLKAISILEDKVKDIG